GRRGGGPRFLPRRGADVPFAKKMPSAQLACQLRRRQVGMRLSSALLFPARLNRLPAPGAKADRRDADDRHRIRLPVNCKYIHGLISCDRMAADSEPDQDVPLRAHFPAAELDGPGLLVPDHIAPLTVFPTDFV